MKIRVVAIIQARMGSTRLKRKALRKIEGKTLIETIFRRLKASKEIDDVVLSTADTKENDVLIKHAKAIGLKYSRGPEYDLIARYLNVCKDFKGDAIVKITGDCVMVDPELLDRMVKIYRKNSSRLDVVTNVFPKATFPAGLDLDIISKATLERLDKEVQDPFFRECLTMYIAKNRDRFRIYNFKNKENLFDSRRLMIDYLEDLIFARQVFKALDKKNKIFLMKDVINLLKRNPKLLKINAKWLDKKLDWNKFIKNG